MLNTVQSSDFLLNILTDTCRVTRKTSGFNLYLHVSGVSVPSVMITVPLRSVLNA